MKTHLEFKRYIKNVLSQEKIILFTISGNKFWYLNGKRHREDGPAIIYSNGEKRWYLNGERYY